MIAYVSPHFNCEYLQMCTHIIGYIAQSVYITICYYIHNVLLWVTARHSVYFPKTSRFNTLKCLFVRLMHNIHEKFAFLIQKRTYLACFMHILHDSMHIWLQAVANCNRSDPHPAGICNHERGRGNPHKYPKAEKRIFATNCTPSGFRGADLKNSAK